ncbi:unnamed protein product [Didymodactylos carnosus]|uniref:Uncharacterized protein n=1 Tax=Didymodactylos carnosus TaxID=1234261 RepID=A0A8S2FVW1_9BILA|nr:unnamed protein product [Didymodactylos carnosus]CAF4365687.1 unnamed protein product [Didymodactylos carnosus]
MNMYMSAGHLIQAARTMDEIGFLFIEQDDYKHGLYYLAGAVEMFEECSPIDHRRMGYSLCGTGTCYMKQANYQCALCFQLQSLKTRQKILLNNHAHIAQSYRTISSAYCELKDYSVLFNHHPNVARTFRSFDIIYQRTGDREEALEYFLRAQYILEKCLPQNHPDIIRTIQIKVFKVPLRMGCHYIRGIGLL